MLLSTGFYIERGEAEVVLLSLGLEEMLVILSAEFPIGKQVVLLSGFSIAMEASASVSRIVHWKGSWYFSVQDSPW